MEQYLIGIAVLLLSATAGAFLLAKTKKEELGIFYKVIAWFVIVFSLLMIFCSALHCIVCREMRMENRFKQCEMFCKEHPEMMEGAMPFMMRENENFRFREMHDRVDGRDNYRDGKEGHKDENEGCMDGKDGFKDGKDACCKDVKKEDSSKDGNSIKK